MTRRRAARNELGPFIRSKREAAGLSLRELAEMTGLAFGFLGDIETGRRGIKLPGHTISMLADALSIPVALITLKMTKTSDSEYDKYTDYYRVLRSGVRAKQIARQLDRIRNDCTLALDPGLSPHELKKLLQDIENAVEKVDKTLSYRGTPPVSVQMAGQNGDDDKFRLDLSGGSRRV